MYFKITITNATLPDNFCRNTFVEYTILDNEGKQSTFKTEMVNTHLKKKQENVLYMILLFTRSKVKTQDPTTIMKESITMIG